MKGIQKILASRFWWVFLLLGMVVLNYLASDFHARIDLTKEKRYTLSRATINLLRNLDSDVQIDVFLKGEFPSGFRKLANSTEEFLRLMKDRSPKLQFRFISPLEEVVPGVFYGDSLSSLGAIPINLTVQKEAGQSSNIVFPVALIKYKGRQSLVNLYPAASGRISQDEINSAEALMEYQFANALSKLSQSNVPAIVYATGNGEPTDGRIMDLDRTLARDYRFAPVDISRDTIPDIADVLMIVKPTMKFTDEENLRIDQFVMRGGKLLCFIDNLYAEQDSLAFKPETVAFDRDLNLTNLFFRYGLRINTDLVMDLSCDRIPFVVGGTQENPQFAFLPWNYYPFLLPSGNAFNRNMGYVSGRFVNSIDTITVPGVKKTPLLVTSPNSRIISTPALISLNENKQVPEDIKFRLNAIPAAMLLEGSFPSLFRNRLPKSVTDSMAASGRPYLQSSPDNKMIIVADGDIVLNELRPGGGPGTPPEPLPMGWNRFTYGEYENQSENGRYFYPAANRDFLLGCIEYLVNDPGISETKNKDIVLRLLDTKKVTAQRGTWQFINIAVPVLIVLLAGWLYQQIRKRKYAA